MKILKLDITKLITIANYARKINKSVVWVYKLGKEKQIDIVEIDGVKFVNLAENPKKV